MNTTNSSYSWEPQMFEDIAMFGKIYYAIVVGTAIFVTLFWIVYFSHDIMVIKQRLNRFKLASSYENNDTDIKRQEAKLFQKQILILICISEILPAIFAIISNVLGVKKHLFDLVSILEFYSFSLIYLTSYLLNKLTTHLIHCYKSKVTNYRRVFSMLFLKLILILLVSPVNIYLLLIPNGIIFLLFIREFIQYIKNCNKLYTVIGWQEQDTVLEFGAKNRVLYLQRTRRQFRRLFRLGICCTSCLLLVIPNGIMIEFLGLVLTRGGCRDLLAQFIYAKIIDNNEIIEKINLGIDILDSMRNIIAFPLSIFALVYIVFTLHFWCGSVLRDLNTKLYYYLRSNSNNSIKNPLLLK